MSKLTVKEVIAHARAPRVTVWAIATVDNDDVIPVPVVKKHFIAAIRKFDRDHILTHVQIDTDGDIIYG